MLQKYKETLEVSEFDKKMMLRCIHLAYRGLGNVSPNPMVGAVITFKGQIIGEGYHRKFGQPHAEVIAIESVKQPDLLNQATLYVNLEPCSHYGKTPPCTDLIISKSIKQVIIGTSDTYSQVDGRGIERLKSAGIGIKTGVLEQESRFLNRRFFTFNEKKRPYIILKWAQTLDHFIDQIRPPEQPPQWITNDQARVLVHQWRANEDSILIGSRTALLDNPALNIRYSAGNNPTRIILDLQGNLPHKLKVFDNTQPTILFTTFAQNYQPKIPNLTIKQIKPTSSLKEILNELYVSDIQSVVIEGGAQILNSFIEQNLWDEAKVFTGRIKFGKGIAAPKIELEPTKYQHIGNTILETYFNKTN